MPSFFCGKCLFCFCTASFDSAIPGVFLSHPSSLFRRKKNSFAGVCPGSISFAPPRGEEYAAVANVRKYFCPLPPTRARRALFPRWGRGRFLLSLQGAPPLATPRLRPRGAGSPGGFRSLPGIRGASPVLRQKLSVSYREGGSQGERGDRGERNFGA